MQDRGKELAEAHWAYIDELLKAHRAGENERETAKADYIPAFEHGYKHGREDERDNESFTLASAIDSTKPGDRIVVDKKGRRIK